MLVLGVGVFGGAKRFKKTCLALLGSVGFSFFFLFFCVLRKMIRAALKTKETGTILTTHYMEEAEAVCDRVAILVAGQLRWAVVWLGQETFFSPPGSNGVFPSSLGLLSPPAWVL